MLPTEDKLRKQIPIASGVIDYFPRAIAYIAYVSFIASQQHNPGKPMMWDRTKSKDHANTAMRHFMERGKRDKDGLRHSGKFGWRALALLETELEAAEKAARKPKRKRRK